MIEIEDRYSRIERLYQYSFTKKCFSTCLSHSEGGNFFANRSYNHEELTVDQVIEALEDRKQRTPTSSPQEAERLEKAYRSIRDILLSFPDMDYKQNKWFFTDFCGMVDVHKERKDSELWLRKISCPSLSR